MKLRYFTAIALVALFAVGGWVLKRHSKGTGGALSVGDSRTNGELPKMEEAARPRSAPTPSALANRILSAFSTPIALHGRVIDQDGNPIPAARVRYTVIDKFDAPGSRYEKESAANGDFDISGIAGAVLLVKVTKDGYRIVPGESDAAFAFGMPPDATRRSPPSGVVSFHLHKPGDIRDDLAHALSRELNVPTDGKGAKVDLTTAKLGHGDLLIQAWVGDTSLRPFDWRFRISVPGGGIVECKSSFDFTAPSEGYSSSAEVGADAVSLHWPATVTKTYFAQLPAGNYSRFKIQFFPGHHTYVVLEAYVNPAIGDRNTESAPNEDGISE